MRAGRIALSLLLAVAGSGAVTRADDWPQFRGPVRPGTLRRCRLAARVERIAEHRVEDAGTRARVVVARGRRRPRLADDVGQRERRVASRHRLRRRQRHAKR